MLSDFNVPKINLGKLAKDAHLWLLPPGTDLTVVPWIHHILHLRWAYFPFLELPPFFFPSISNPASH